MLREKADLAEVAQHARMDKIDPRGGRHRIGGGRLAALRQAASEPSLGAVECAGEAVGMRVGKAVSRKDQAPGSDRDDGRALSCIAARRQGKGP